MAATLYARTMVLITFIHDMEASQPTDIHSPECLAFGEILDTRLASWHPTLRC